MDNTKEVSGHGGVLTGLGDQEVYATLYNDDDGASSHRTKAWSEYAWTLLKRRLHLVGGGLMTRLRENELAT